MRNFILSCSFFLSMHSLAGVQQDLPKTEAPSLKDPKEIIDLQIASLDHLIRMNEKSLEMMKGLKAHIQKYKLVQEAFLLQPKDKQLLYRMSKLASSLLNEINAANLSHAFDEEFIKELVFLNKIYKKRELPKL